MYIFCLQETPVMRQNILEIGEAYFWKYSKSR